jgi:DNA-binding transcriptional MerR regulator
MDVTLSIEELAERSGVPVRTIRFYITEGLVPGPIGRGRSAAYGQEHLQRLGLIRLFSARHLPLAEQRAMLESLSSRDLQTLLEEEERGAATQSLTGPTGRAYISSLLQNARGAQRDPPGLAPGRLYSGTRASPEQAEPEAWLRYRLVDGVELQVRDDLDGDAQSLVGRLLQVVERHRSRQRWQR